MVIPPLDPPHAHAALRLGAARAAPGKPFLAAVEIATDPHWHVYWKNPGDSGVPTRIRWSAPKGWRVEPLEFPTPKRFSPGGITAYGYEGKTLFLARITPSKTPGTLGASVSWLVCSEACVQGSAVVSARVALGAPKPAPQARTLQAAERELPQPLKGRVGAWAGGGLGAPKAVYLSIPARVPGGSSSRTAEFFPSVSGLVDQGAPLLATLSGGDLVFKMKPSPFPEHRTRVSGLVVYGTGKLRRAWYVDPILKLED